ncbi:MAG: HAMP domain-containing protein [Anaerolineales bacterium]|nr:HAMP domain-containing protein [Anaerolineales bacterium]
MPLRVRLTLFYTSVLGVVFVLFGIAVYATISIVLTRQIDNTLDQTVTDIFKLARFDAEGQFGLLVPISFDPRVVVQVWDTEGNLLAATTNELETPLDKETLTSEDTVDSYVWHAGKHYRVLTRPFEGDYGMHGIMQAGIDMAEVDQVQKDLLQYLIIMGLIAISVAGLAGWASTHRALEPLATMTETALKITRADDLSMRIPEQEPGDDEVGQLIRTFNQTLERLEELFHSQRRFLTDVGHELRTPLTVIKGNVDLMRRMGEHDEESLASIEGEVDRLARLVEDLLLLAQAESGKLPLDFRRVELDTLLLEVFQQARVLAGDCQEVQIGDFDQVAIKGDRDRIKQVMLNLVGNAIRYTPDEGKIVLSLGKKGNWAQFIVRDNGPGIPEEDLPHVFERFYRAEKSRSRLRAKRNGKGFGLGLSIAYWIVRNHGGRIEVDSQVGQGTTFCVWLPLEGTYEPVLTESESNGSKV